jgi:hypothetical protein
MRRNKRGSSIKNEEKGAKSKPARENNLLVRFCSQMGSFKGFRGRGENWNISIEGTKTRERESTSHSHIPLHSFFYFRSEWHE